MTRLQALQTGEVMLAQLNFESSEALIILASVLKKEQAHILTYPENTITTREQRLFFYQIRHRLDGLSVAAIIGEKAFYGARFFVNTHVLIPRPETELLVSEALRLLQHSKYKTILDIGTGSGALVIAIALHSKNYNHTYYATDISQKALTIARQNSKHHGCEIGFYEADLLPPVVTKYDLITANLPYLTPTEMLEPSIQREPFTALAGGIDGLAIYRQLANTIKPYLADKYTMLLEANPQQMTELKKIMLSALAPCNISINKDLAQNQRLMIISSQEYQMT